MQSDPLKGGISVPRKNEMALSKAALPSVALEAHKHQPRHGHEIGRLPLRRKPYVKHDLAKAISDILAEPQPGFANAG